MLHCSAVERFTLREVFDYRGSKNKKECIKKMYNFVRNNPQMLIYSVKSL